MLQLHRLTLEGFKRAYIGHRKYHKSLTQKEFNDVFSQAKAMMNNSNALAMHQQYYPSPSNNWTSGFFSGL